MNISDKNFDSAVGVGRTHIIHSPVSLKKVGKFNVTIT